MGKSSGFGVVPIILAIASIVLLGLVGWRLYDTNNSQHNPGQTEVSHPSGARQPSNPTTPRSDPAAFLDIKDLGVKIRLGSEVEDLTYSVTTLSDGSKAVRFSTEALAAVDPSCDASSGQLGSLGRTTTSTDPTIFKKLGDYYFTYVSPQALCSEKVRSMLGQSQAALREALRTMELD